MSVECPMCSRALADPSANLDKGIREVAARVVAEMLAMDPPPSQIELLAWFERVLVYTMIAITQAAGQGYRDYIEYMKARAQEIVNERKGAT